MVEKIRLSLGTAIEFGLEKGEADRNFTTLFFMTYHEEKCESNCAFCPQARESAAASDRLSRISWPEYGIDSVIKNWPSSGKFQRICIQSINYHSVVQDVIDIVKRIREVTLVPISIAIHPIMKEEMKLLKKVGVSNIGISVDACTPELFEKIKGKSRKSSYRWDMHIQALKDSLKVFGKGRVTTHLIIGLGETEREVVDFIFKMAKMNVSVGLFAFTSIKGTALENAPQPDLSSYRRIQIIRYLVANGELKENQVKYNEKGQVSIILDPAIITELLLSGSAFRVSGCKGCNRPYYNERPRGPIYNYPRPLNQDEITNAIQKSGLVG